MHLRTRTFVGPAVAISISIAIAIAIAYWIVGALCRSLASSGTQTVPVWLGAGVIVGALLVAPVGRRAAVLIGALIASYVWALVAHRLHPAAGLPFALIEVTSAGVGAWVAQRFGRNGANNLAEVSWLIAGALLAALLGATLAAEFWRWQRTDAAYGLEWRAWAFSTLVGILLAAPVITAFRGFQARRSGGMPMAQFSAGAAAFAVFVLLAWVVFSAGVYQRFGTMAATLGYLPMPFLLLCAMLWGARGGALAMLVGSLLVISKTATGGGPFAVADGFAGEAVIEVQAYVAVWAMLMLLARGLYESRRKAKMQARDWQLRYERILGATGTVSVEFDAVTGDAIWDTQAATVLGDEVLASQNAAEWLARIDASDRPLAEAAWHTVAQGRQPSVTHVYTAQLGGRAQAVQAQLAAVRGPDGAVERVVGLLRPLEATIGGSAHG